MLAPQAGLGALWPSSSQATPGKERGLRGSEGSLLWRESACAEQSVGCFPPLLPTLGEDGRRGTPRAAWRGLAGEEDWCPHTASRPGTHRQALLREFQGQLELFSGVWGHIFVWK